jgi:hypothetical protein
MANAQSKRIANCPWRPWRLGGLTLFELNRQGAKNAKDKDKILYPLPVQPLE